MIVKKDTNIFSKNTNSKSVTSKSTENLKKKRFFDISQKRLEIINSKLEKFSLSDKFKAMVKDKPALKFVLIKSSETNTKNNLKVKQTKQKTFSRFKDPFLNKNKNCKVTQKTKYKYLEKKKKEYFLLQGISKNKKDKYKSLNKHNKSDTFSKKINKSYVSKKIDPKASKIINCNKKKANTFFDKKNQKYAVSKVKTQDLTYLDDFSKKQKLSVRKTDVKENNFQNKKKDVKGYDKGKGNKQQMPSNFDKKVQTLVKNNKSSKLVENKYDKNIKKDVPVSSTKLNKNRSNYGGNDIDFQKNNNRKSDISFLNKNYNQKEFKNNKNYNKNYNKNLFENKTNNKQNFFENRNNRYFDKKSNKRKFYRQKNRRYFRIKLNFHWFFGFVMKRHIFQKYKKRISISGANVGKNIPTFKKLRYIRNNMRFKFRNTWPSRARLERRVRRRFKFKRLNTFPIRVRSKSFAKGKSSYRRQVKLDRAYRMLFRRPHLRKKLRLNGRWDFVLDKFYMNYFNLSFNLSAHLYYNSVAEVNQQINYKKISLNQSHPKNFTNLSKGDVIEFPKSDLWIFDNYKHIKSRRYLYSFMELDDYTLSLFVVKNCYELSKEDAFLMNIATSRFTRINFLRR